MIKRHNWLWFGAVHSKYIYAFKTTIKTKANLTDKVNEPIEQQSLQLFVSVSSRQRKKAFFNRIHRSIVWMWVCVCVFRKGFNHVPSMDCLPRRSRCPNAGSTFFLGTAHHQQKETNDFWFVRIMNENQPKKRLFW